MSVCLHSSAQTSARSAALHSNSAEPSHHHVAAQTWGLTELQLGNVIGATKLLQRCVRLDPSNLPVLKWKPVQAAMSAAEVLRLGTASAACTLEGAA